MLVRITGVSSPPSTAFRRVERITEGVVSVDWKLSAATDHAPLVHLHVGNGTAPPTDLTFDSHDGRLAGVQVVLQDEPVREQHVFGSRLPAEMGLPIADLTPWRGEEQILDHVFRPVPAWEPTGTLSMRIARTSSLPSKEYVVEGLSVVVDAHELVLGLRMSGFDQDEIALISS